MALPETEAISAQMQVIDSSTTHMVDLINDLVDVTRSQLEHGEHLHRIRVDLVSLAQEVVAQQQISAVHRIELRTSLTSLKARVDGPRVHRLLNNLLSNAVKYSPNGGVIQVRLSRDTGTESPEAVIAVRDQGIGIPAADLPRIFERFQRASNVLPHIQGTGIGLASVQRIVALHGGTVTAENNAEGGATFTVRLPLGPIDNDA